MQREPNTAKQAINQCGAMEPEAHQGVIRRSVWPINRGRMATLTGLACYRRASMLEARDGKD